MKEAKALLEHNVATSVKDSKNVFIFMNTLAVTLMAVRDWNSSCLKHWYKVLLIITKTLQRSYNQRSLPEGAWDRDFENQTAEIR